MAIFTLSCFGLLLYLWSAFGGPVPLKPHGYRFKASFAEATQLAQEADVRISGVTVGKVKKIELGDDGRTEATIELDDKYAPIPLGRARDPAPEDAARRDLRRADARHQGRAAAARRTASSRRSNVAPTVELDEIFRSFDKKTREAFQVWQQDVARGHRGARPGLLGRARPASSRSPRTRTRCSRSSTRRRARSKQLVENTGEVFDALTERRRTARRPDRQLEPRLRHDRAAGPRRSGRPSSRCRPSSTSRRRRCAALEAYAANTEPADHGAAPVGARGERHASRASKRSRPTSTASCRASGPLVTRRRRASRPACRFLDDLRPLLGQLDPFLRNLNPFLRYLGLSTGTS